MKSTFLEQIPGRTDVPVTDLRNQAARPGRSKPLPRGRIQPAVNLKRARVHHFSRFTCSRRSVSLALHADSHHRHPMMPDSPPAEAGAPQRLSTLSWLAPAALGLLPAVLLAFSSVEKNEAYDWMQHRLVGVGFGVAFVTVLLLGPWRRNGLTLVAGAVAAIAMAALGWRAGLADFHPLFAVAALLVAGGYWLSRRPAPAAWLETAVVALGAMVSFWAVSRLSWWQPLAVTLQSWPNRLLFLGVTAGLAWVLRTLVAAPSAAAPGRLTRLIDVGVLAVLAAAVLRTNTIAGNFLFPHHWGVYVAAADMVRDGGTLLGNVPSQYGFLNTLLLAVLPTDDRHTALYWLNIVLVWTSGAIIYFTLRTWLARWWWQLGSGLIMLCCVAFLCGDAPALTGPLPCPSIAAVRFIWVHLLLGWLVWWHRRAATHPGTIRAALWTGSALWLGGVLWSLESAAYVTATWFPAAAVLAMRPAVEPRARLARILDLLAGIGRALVIPGLLLAVALAALVAYYRLALGQLPVWSRYGEYAAAFSGGFFALPIEPGGGVWALLLLHVAFLGTLTGMEIDRRRASLALLWAAWGAFWIVSTYYISRSHLNNITNISPVLLLAVGAMVHAWGTGERRGPAGLWIWLAVPAFTGALVWLVLTNADTLKHQWETYAVEPRAGRLLPPAPAALTELLELCQQRQPGPCAVVDRSSYYFASGPAPTAWLPLDSVSLYIPLPAEQRIAYLEANFPARSGWLVFPAAADTEYNAWLFSYLQTTYSFDLTLEHGDWRAWFLIPHDKSRPPGR
jgi:hypothetical protein